MWRLKYTKEKKNASFFVNIFLTSSIASKGVYTFCFLNFNIAQQYRIFEAH
jgi:hypothetical protein